MSLWRLREERKRLGPGTRKGPGTWILVLLLGAVLFLIYYLGTVGS